MDNLSCRICLATNIRMHSIINTQVLQVYEKFIDKSVTDTAPMLACYMCYSLLKKCHLMMILCKQSEKLLTQEELHRTRPTTNEMFGFNSLSISPLRHINIPELIECKVTVKEEPNDEEEPERTEVKLEIEEHGVSFPEHQSPIDNNITREVDANNQTVMENLIWSEPELLSVCMSKSSEDHNKTDPDNVKDSTTKSTRSITNKSISPITNPEIIHQCNICKKNFQSKSKLTRHIRIHTGEKPFACDLCDSRFNEKTNLNRHKRTHTGVQVTHTDQPDSERIHPKETSESQVQCTSDKLYKCDICQTSFNEKGHLIRHTRTHTGEKPYKCHLCSKRFNQKAHLQRHMLVHSGEKPFQCDICKCRFSQQYNLVKHVRIHTGVRPHRCDICQRGFSDKSKLHKHIATGHMIYECDTCHERFSRKSHLKSHRAALHPV